MKNLFTLFILIIAINVQAQSKKVYLNHQIYGEVDNTYSGVGVGTESFTKEKSVLSIETAFGFGKDGNALLFQPGIQFYSKKERTGFYYGPIMKFTRIFEHDEEQGRVDDSLYALGLNFGYKSAWNERYALTLDLSPHHTIGGPNEAEAMGMSFSLGLSF